MMYVEFMKNFPLPIRTTWWLLDSFRPPELISPSWAQKRFIPTFLHDVRRVHEKFFFRRFERADAC